MCRLAVEDVPALSVCAHEIERGGVSYTVDTLSWLHAHHPRAELTLILGADTARTLDAWREPRRLLELARLAVAERAGVARAAVLDALAGPRVQGAPAGSGATPARVSFLHMPPVEISSSLARRRAAAGEPIERLVGPAVAAYVARHRLYRAAAGVGA